MKKILIVSLMMVCVFAYAQEKIDSAFGWTLGQTVSSNIKLELINKRLGFYFEPTKKTSWIWSLLGYRDSAYEKSL